MNNRSQKALKSAPFFIILAILALSACQTGVPAPTPTPTVPPTATMHPDAGSQTAQSVTFTTANQESVEPTYLIYLPEGYNGEQEWPLIVNLHGANGRGSNISAVLYNNPINVDLNRGLDLPAIVFSPQAPAGTIWNEQIPLLESYLTAIEEKYAVDSSRIYLTGFSMGGIGSWAWGLENPSRFAAVVPVAGGILYDRPVPENICDLKDTPIRAFAGADDRIIPPAHVQKVIDALEECGANNIHFTIYDGADHGEAGRWPYQTESELYEWLWDQQLP